MAARRAKLKEGVKELVEEHGPALDELAQKRDTRVAKIDPDVIEATEIAPEGSATGEDRANGLPRSNYYGDWVPTIRKMTASQIQKILDHPSIKTSKRG